MKLHQLKILNWADGYQKCKIIQFPHIRGLLEKYPTFGQEKETGLLGALDT